MSNKKRNLIVGILVVIILAVGGGSYWWSTHYQPQVQNQTPKIVKKKRVKKATEQALTQANRSTATRKPHVNAQGQPEKAPQRDTTEFYGWGNLYRSQITPIGTNSEYNDPAALKNNLLNNLAKQQFKTYENQMNKLIDQHHFSKLANLDIAGYYNDEQLYQELLHRDNLSMTEAGTIVARSFKTPETFAILGLYFDQVARGRFIIDPHSLSPIAFSDIKYQGTKKYLKSDLQQAPQFQGHNLVRNCYNVTGQGAVYVVRLDIKSSLNTYIPYSALIGENRAGRLALYGYFYPDNFKNKVADKELAYFYSADFKAAYENAKTNQAQAIENGYVNVDKIYPWIANGGKSPE